MKRCFLFYCFAIVLHVGAIAQNSPRQQLFSPQQIAEDVAFYYEALQAGHPDLYKYISKPALDTLVAQLQTQPAPLTLTQFYRELSRLNCAIGCGHLAIRYSDKTDPFLHKKSYYPPLFVKVYDTIAVVNSDFWAYKNYGNSRVLSVNGMSIDSIIKDLDAMLPKDGYCLAGSQWQLEEGYFNYQLISYWPDTSRYRYVLQPATDSGWGNPYPVDLAAINYKSIKKRLFYNRKSKLPPQLKLRHDDETNTAILTIESFDPATIRKGKQKFRKFIKDAFWRIYQTQPDQLVIDLRDNSGGSSFYPELVIAFLSMEPYRLYKDYEIKYNSADERQLIRVKPKRAYKKLEKHAQPIDNGNKSVRHLVGPPAPALPYAYGGNVYVMVNGGTYSAATELACYLEQHMEAIIVGAETGGTCDDISAGLIGTATLPNTGIVLHIPLIKLSKDIAPPRQIGCGLKPDIPLHIMPRDPDTDAEMDSLLNIILNK